MIIVVVNDDALGAEYQQLKLQDGVPEAAVVETPELAAVARDFGATGHTIESIDDLEEIGAQLTDDLDGPLVLNCKVNREIRHRFYQGYEQH